MKLLTMLCTFMYSSIYIAQSYTSTLTGYVIDLHDQETLADATLSIEKFGNTININTKEKYTFSNLCNGVIYTLGTSHLLSNTSIMDVTINGNTECTINMEHHLKELGEISITGKALKNGEKTAVESQVFNEIIQVNNAGSLRDALNQLSGVPFLNTGNKVIMPVNNFKNNILF